MDIPSRRLREGDVVSIRSGSTVRPPAPGASELVARVPAWLPADRESLVGRVEREPRPDEIQAPVDERLIVKFYSRVWGAARLLRS